MKPLRDLGLHPLRTMTVVVTIAVGIAGAGSVLDTYSLLQRTVTDGYRATEPPSATLVLDSVDDTLLSALLARPDLEAGEVRMRVDGRVRVEEEWRRLRLFAFRDFDRNRIGRVAPEAGAWPPLDGQVVLEQSSISVAGAMTGDTLTVVLPRQPAAELPVVGLARDVGLAPGWMEHVVYGYATPATLKRLESGVLPARLRIRVRENAQDEDHVRRVAFRVKRFVEARGVFVHDVSIPTPGRHVHAGQMNSLLFLQGAFGVLALLLGAVLVVNLMAAVMADEVRQVGVMKALGARTGQVVGVYLFMAGVMGLGAAIPGIALGAWAGRAYAGFAAELLNFDVEGHRIGGGVLLIQGILGILLPVAAAAVPVLRGARVPVLSALTDYGIGDGAEGSRPPLLPARGYRGVRGPLLLSIRNAFRRRTRMTLTVLALAVGGATFLGGLNLRAGIRDAVGDVYDAFAHDVTVVFGEPVPSAEVEKILSGVDGVVGFELERRARAAVVFQDGTQGNAVPIVGQDPESGLVDYPVLEGRSLAKADGDAVVVNDLFLDAHPGVALGSRVRFSIEGDTSTRTVAGIVRSSITTPTAYVRRELLADLLGGDERIDRALLSANGREAARVEEVRARAVAGLRAGGLPVREVGTVSEARAVLQDHVLMAAGFLVVMAVLVLVVGGLTLGTAMGLSVLERTREIGVLRAVGARRRTIHRIVVGEGLVVGLASCLLALPASVPVTLLIGSGFGRIMLNVPVGFAVDPWGVLVWLPVMLAVAALASLPPALRATARSPARSLAYR